ncbi:MAG: formyltransferase family protein [Candidatus Phosphoribacter sp.]
MCEHPRLSYAFVGQSLMGCEALAEVIATLGDPAIVLTRRTLDGWPNPVADLCERRGLHWEAVPDGGLDLYDHRLISELAATDVGLCCGWPRRIVPEAYDSPRHGTLNLHPGALPNWAGSDPIGWHLAAGTAPIVCVVHQMTATVDAGPVLAAGTVDVVAEDDAGDLRRRCGATLGRLASEALLMPVLKGPQTPAVDLQQAVPPRGVRPALDPGRLTTATAERVIRAFSPYPGAVAAHNGEWIVVVHPAGPATATVHLDCSDGTLAVGRF